MKKQVLTLLMASLISGTAFAAPGTVTEKTNVFSNSSLRRAREKAFKTCSSRTPKL